MAEMVHRERFDVSRVRSDEQINEFIAALRKGRTRAEMGAKRSSGT